MIETEEQFGIEVVVRGLADTEETRDIFEKAVDDALEQIDPQGEIQFSLTKFEPFVKVSPDAEKPMAERLKAIGFNEWQTGGGCMAWGRTLPDAEREGCPNNRGDGGEVGHIMITNDNLSVPDNPDETVTVGFYGYDSDEDGAMDVEIAFFKLPLRDAVRFLETLERVK